jgi:hypothetical protein
MPMPVDAICTRLRRRSAQTAAMPRIQVTWNMRSIHGSSPKTRTSLAGAGVSARSR